MIMNTKMFMSFASEDKKFIDVLVNRIKSELSNIEPLVVERHKEVGKEFQKKVINILEIAIQR